MYTLTAAQADEGEGTEHLKLRNVKGQGGVRVYITRTAFSFVLVFFEKIVSMYMQTSAVLLCAQSVNSSSSDRFVAKGQRSPRQSAGQSKDSPPPSPSGF